MSGKQTVKRKKDNTNIPVRETVPGELTDDEFYKGDTLPELNSPIPPSIDYDPDAIMKELWSGAGWRRSEQGQDGYKRYVRE